MTIEKKLAIAWRRYKRWREIRTYSPALKKNVQFTRQGWEHITGQNHRKRRLRDIERRLKLLPYARRIITVMPLVQDKRRRGNIIFYALEGMIQMTKKQRMEDRKIRIILKEDRAGIIRFYSIMDKKTKK